jgi:photosystem II stability/assembly factor-like uncharacterized protein
VRSSIVSIALALFALATAAAGQSWVPQRSNTNETLEAVWFTEPNRGFTSGTNGAFLKTNDGGQTWEALSMGTEDLYDISFEGPVNGLVVGDNGTIYRTPDGGNVWEEVQSGVTYNLRACACGMGGRMYAASDEGVIIRSMDGGTSWEVADSSGVRWEAMAAMMDMNAWVVGRDGAVRASMDGGMSWENRTSGTTNDLKAVVFATPTEGYAAGQSSTVIYSSDGGQTWMPRNSGANGSFEGISFPVPNEGWVVGDAGAIFHSMDMGSTWVRETSGVTVALEDVHFVDPTTGWAVGAGGTILKYEVGGVAEQRPVTVARLAVWPSPLVGAAVLTMRSAAPVEAAVVAADGRVVRKLGSGTEFRWSGSDGAGRRVAPGVYYCVARSAGSTSSTPVVVGR